jgi:hypothetical protein
MNVAQQAGLLVAGALISGLIGAGLGALGRWREGHQARRRRQREALLVLNDPLLRLLVELSRQLEQGPDAARGQWFNGTRDIGAAKTWIFDPAEVANTLDWEPSRKLAQELERAWSDRLRLDVFDPPIRAQVEEVRKHARAVGFFVPDTRSEAAQLRDALEKLLETISRELERP